MKKFAKTMLATAALLLGSSAFAVTINQGLKAGFNTIQDEDREAFVDVDKSGTLSVGDVFVGYVQFDGFLPTVGVPQTTNGQVYGIISNQITAIDVLGGGLLSNISLGVTTAAGLRLEDLTGNALTAGGMYAVYDSAVSYGDVVLDSAPAASDMKDVIDYITGGGDLRLVAGRVAATDFLSVVNNALCPGGGPTAGYSSLTVSMTCGSITGGLSVMYNNTNFTFNDTVAAFDPIANVLDTYQIAVSNGTIKGMKNDPHEAVNSLLGIPDFLQCPVNAGNPDGSCGFNTKADFGVDVTPVPEPATLALVGAAMFGLGWSRRRRNQQGA